jgi:preprotein translocase subunit SecG
MLIEQGHQTILQFSFFQRNKLITNAAEDGIKEGNDQGMGIVGGSGNNSFYEKSKGRTLDEKLKKITLFTAILFAVLTVVLFLVLARGL